MHRRVQICSLIDAPGIRSLATLTPARRQGCSPARGQLRRCGQKQDVCVYGYRLYKFMHSTIQAGTPQFPVVSSICLAWRSILPLTIASMMSCVSWCSLTSCQRHA